MVHPDGRHIRHPERNGGGDSGVAGHDSIGAIDQDRIDKTKLLDAGRDLFDLPGRVRAGIFEARFELSRVLVFDCQRLHSAP